MKKKYLVYIREDGARFYYRDKKLHRECGPAIVRSENVKKFTGLADEDLYEKTFDPKKIINPSKKLSVNPETTSENLCEIMLEERMLEDTIYNPNVEEAYYLDGMKYNQQIFFTITLKSNLEKNLPIKEDKAKRIKI